MGSSSAATTSRSSPRETRQTKAKLVSVFQNAPSEFIGPTNHELHHALACYEQGGGVRHRQRPLGAAVRRARRREPDARCPHGPRPAATGARGSSTSRSTAFAPRVGLISLSMNQRSPLPHLNWIANCPNALDLSLYPVHPHRGDYLLFLGRMSPDKGAHRAVEVAEAAGAPAQARREDAGAPRGGVLRRSRQAAPQRTTSSTSARSPTRRRSTCSRTRERRSSRSSGRSRSGWS